MKNVLYIGNALSKKGKTLTSVEILGKSLSEFCKVKIASNQSNKIMRLLDMILLVLRNVHRTDYVIIDTYSTTNFNFALIISIVCNVFGLKYIPILRGGNLEHRLKNNSKKSKFLFLNAYKLVAPSNFLISVFNKYGFNNILYIPNTIKVDDYKFLKRPISTIKLLWVRSFNAIYNPKMALRVQKSLVSMGYDCELTMIGPSSDNSFEDCKDFAKLNELKVHFTGKLSKSAWILLSEQSNIFINTTNFDNTPVSVIEAMALGLPVISTNVGGMPFLIEHYVDGILIDPDDVDNMANEIIRLSQDEQLVKQLTSNARNKVEQFDWNVVKTKWEELLS